jgi:leader peptidase (prepilin peptidase) / N-methyltransferase
VPLILPVWMSSLLIIGFGLIVGSFLNVVIVRLPLGQSIVTPRSHCMRCHSTIRWWDNLPVLSFLLLRGKCRACQAPISLRYPVIEVLTALLFFASQLKLGWSPTLVVRDWVFLSLLIAVTFIDLEHRIIPDQLSIGGCLYGLATSWMGDSSGWLPAVVGAVLGFGFFYLLAWVYYQVRGRSGLGGGDIKLLAAIGAFIGPMGVLVTILLSSVLGSLIGVVWAWRSHQKQILGYSIPFGPFLVLGALYYYLLGDTLWFLSMIQM